MAMRVNGDQRNAKGKCYIYACPNKLHGEITYFDKRVKVCKKHMSCNGMR